jgi:predicted protein tyrosine phosphatase
MTRTIPGDVDFARLPAVESLAGARSAWTDFDAVISIEDATREADDGRSFAFPADHPLARERRLPAHLRLVFDDIDEPAAGFAGPESGQIREALAFARLHRDRRLLIHCHSGQCRSAAVALGVIAERLGAGREADAVAVLLRMRPIAAPNLMALALVDAELGRGGALAAAWMAHESGEEKLLRLRFLRKAYYAGEAGPGNGA